MKKQKHLLVDLFAGCGGLSTGMEQAGFTPWFVNEIVPIFCNTYKCNHKLPDSHYYVGDINQLNKDIAKFQDILSDISIVCGGPPCQGFSTANRQRIIDDPRNNLYKAYLQFLSVVRPKFFVMENVRGMANKIEEIKQNFREYLGEEYQFDAAVLQAQDFGVPQNRKRLIMIGNRMGINPAEIFAEIEKQKRPAFVLKDALEGLPSFKLEQKRGEVISRIQFPVFLFVTLIIQKQTSIVSLTATGVWISCTITKIGTITREILRYLVDSLKAVTHYTLQLLI